MCFVRAVFKNNSRCGVGRDCTDAKIQGFKIVYIDAKIKEKFDDAILANLQEQFRKRCTILISCGKQHKKQELLTLWAPIARYTVQLHFWLHEFNKYYYVQKHK